MRDAIDPGTRPVQSANDCPTPNGAVARFLADRCFKSLRSTVGNGWSGTGGRERVVGFHPTDDVFELATRRALRPHTGKFRLSKGKQNKTVNVGTEPELATKLIADGYDISGHPISKALPGTSGSEVELREGGKWETVRRIDLSMQARSLLDPRLDLAYVARKSGLLQPSAAPLDFTLLVSVMAPKVGTLYSDVEAAYPILSRLDVASEPPITTTINN